MGQTTKLLLPWPEPTDPADGPAAFQSLAQRAELTLAPASVTALPSSPYDGQVVDYVADAAAGIIWRLRYRAAAPAPYRWEFIGGPVLATYSALDSSRSAAGYGDLIAGAGPSLTVPLAGDYTILLGTANGYCNTAGQAWSMSFKIGAAAAVDLNALGGGSVGATPARTQRVNAIPAATVLLGQYKVTSGAMFITYPYIAITPVRVG